MREILAKILQIGENFSQNEGKIQNSPKKHNIACSFSRKTIVNNNEKLEMA